MADITIEDLLKHDGPVAIIIKQPLTPVDEDDRVIFPPTYPMTKWNGRVHTIRDGEYRVTVELPTGSKTDKDEKKDNQRPGYQIDYFPDQTNICEIDSVQSQSNRIEPKFKTINDGNLVPQVEIRVGRETVNLLDVGHRAGDAVVRMSSLAAEIHDAFTAAKSGDFFKLALIAPTSLVFGVWDSRSTQVKQQRIFKAHIRATDVREISRSAQYTPATGYVDVGAISEETERKTGDESNLSQEGMVHALSTQSLGGVMLTDTSRLVRTVYVNLEAIRTLRGFVPAPIQRPPDASAEGRTADATESAQIDGTQALQRYVLGLALVAATYEPDLNLREGCHLTYKHGSARSVRFIYRSKAGVDQELADDDVLRFAEAAKSEFFSLAGVDQHAIDRRDVVFETGVAEKFLTYPQGDRDKIRKLGPITQVILDRFEAQGKDPFKTVTDGLKNVLKDLGDKPRGRNAPPVRKLEAFSNVAELLDQLATAEAVSEGTRELASELAKIAREHDNSHDALKHIEGEIRRHKKAHKEGTPTSSD